MIATRGTCELERASFLSAWMPDRAEVINCLVLDLPFLSVDHGTREYSPMYPA
jgi:hypothetical protein